MCLAIREKERVVAFYRAPWNRDVRCRACTPPAPTMGTFSQRLKAMDIYRRIPKDLTEATLAGGSI